MIYSTGMKQSCSEGLGFVPSLGFAPRRLRACTLVLLAFLLLLVATRAWAHAILVRSLPKAHDVVASGELYVELHFNSRIDAARSGLTLILPGGLEEKVAPLPQPSPAALAGKTKRLAPGAYVLRWLVLANDGHITRGEVPFEVK